MSFFEGENFFFLLETCGTPSEGDVCVVHRHLLLPGKRFTSPLRLEQPIEVFDPRVVVDGSPDLNEEP